jgi:hypothetical protein
MTRAAFTLLYNGAHHLRHNDYWRFMADTFDPWIIVEGAAHNGGSTNLCNNIQDDPHSTDGTREMIGNIVRQHKNVKYVRKTGYWKSKDAMVNAAIDCLRRDRIKDCHLWQVDVDEQWTLPIIEYAERVMDNGGYNTVSFCCRHYVGQNICAWGEWGGNNEWRRLWHWQGARALTHEPPVFDMEEKKRFITVACFDHFAYYFAKDVLFKGQYYKKHETVFNNWLAINNLPETAFPIPLSRLFAGSAMEGVKGEINLVSRVPKIEDLKKE